MKKIIAISSFILLSTTGIAKAEETSDLTKNLSGAFGFFSDYAYRGISQTQKNPATQGNIDFNKDGFKLGVWGSNVDFGSTSDANTEFDSYASYTAQFDKLSWENGVIYTAYPGASSSFHYNYTELFTNAGYDFGKIKTNISLNYSPDFNGDSGTSFYPKFAFSVPLPHDLTFDGSIGRQYVQNNLKYGVPDYDDWNLGLAYTLNGYTLKAQYVDTNLSKNKCANDNCSARGIFSVSKAF